MLLVPEPPVVVCQRKRTMTHVDDAHSDEIIAPGAEPTTSQLGRQKKRAKLADGGAGGTDENTGALVRFHADI